MSFETQDLNLWITLRICWSSYIVALTFKILSGNLSLIYIIKKKKQPWLYPWGGRGGWLMVRTSLFESKAEQPGFQMQLFKDTNLNPCLTSMPGQICQMD